MSDLTQFTAFELIIAVRDETFNPDSLRAWATGIARNRPELAGEVLVCLAAWCPPTLEQCRANVEQAIWERDHYKPALYCESCGEEMASQPRAKKFGVKEIARTGMCQDCYGRQVRRGASDPDGVRQRREDVARLTEKGLSASQIAAQLRISGRTVVRDRKAVS